MIRTWSRINFLGSGGKENVEESVRNVIMTTLGLKGAKKAGKVGFSIHLAFQMSSCVNIVSRATAT